MKRTILFLIIIAVLPNIFPLRAYSAVGDGIVVYESTNAPANAPKYRYYTVASGTLSSEYTLPAAAATIVRTVVRANPQADEYIVGVGTSSAASTLYVYTYSGGAWALDWSARIPPATFQRFDVAYEQDSGDGMVIYSTGTITNTELAYRQRSGGTWPSSSTNINSARTNGVIEWIQAESRPGSDEIAVAFSDTADDLSALVWDGSSWTSEPAAVLNATLPTSNNRKFDLAYEQSSGDVILCHGIQANTTTVMYSLKLSGQVNWNTSNLTVADTPNYIDLSAEPGSNYAGFASLTNSATSADLQASIWDGGNWTGIVNNQDIVASSVPYTQPVSCGWSGTGTQRRLNVIYADTGATARLTLTYYTWNKNSATWEQAVDAPMTYSPPYPANKIKRIIYTEHDPNFSTNGKLWAWAADSLSDLWVFTSTGTGAAEWLTIDSGAAGNNAVETSQGLTYPSAGLAITSFNPTLVDLVMVKAETRDNEAVISWSTANELLTAGFKVYRTFSPDDSSTYEELTPVPIRAGGNPFSGRSYEFIDTKPLKGAFYVIEEVLRSGQQRKEVVVRLDDPSTFRGVSPQEKTKPVFQRNGRFLVGDVSVSRRLTPFTFDQVRYASPANQNPLKIEVTKEAIYRISRDDLRAAGWDTQTIDPRKIAVFNQDKEVPLYAEGERDGTFGRDDYFLFYGAPLDTRYTTTNVYWVVQLGQKGLRMPSVTFNKTRTITEYYRHAERLEENVSYFGELDVDEHWFFAEEFGSPATFGFSIEAADRDVAQAEATLSVALQGASRLGVGPVYLDQRARISLNGQQIGEASWQGDVPYLFTSTIDASLIREGANTVAIEAPDDDGELLQYFLLDRIELAYPKKLIAKDNCLVFPSPATVNMPHTYKVRGLTSPRINVFLVSGDTVLYERSFHLKREGDGTYSVLFSDDTPVGKRYVVTAEEAIERVATIRADEVSTLKSPQNRADYLIITHSSFIDGLQPLITLRGSQGLVVKTVDIQDVYDEFSAGNFTPQAIKDFLAYVHGNWQHPLPLFVLLVGDATFDYRDFFEIGAKNLLPAYLVWSQGMGETATDNYYADIDDDIVPEFYIGRLPVSTNAECAAVIDKILTYESGSPSAPWTKEAMFVADDEVEFEELSDALAGMLPAEYSAEKLYLASSDAATVKSGIIDGINEGRLLFNYTGHAGVTLLSPSRIFQTSDVDSLSNAGLYPIFMSLNCIVGYFIYPEGLDGLSETLLRAQGKGIIAAITPSGLSSSPEQSVFMQGFYDGIFQDNDTVLGSLHFKAKKKVFEYYGSSTNPRSKSSNVIQTYNLLGDPALIMRKEGAPSQYTPELLRTLYDTLN